MKLVALAAAMAAFALPAMAGEAKPDPFVAKMTLAAEAPYWAIVCERQFVEYPNLAVNVYAYTLGALSKMSETGQTKNIAEILQAIGEIGEEAVVDKDANKYTAAECQRVVDNFALSWFSL